MTTFPAVIPSTRTRTPGTYPQRAITAANGQQIRLRVSNASADDQMQLSFENTTLATVNALNAHWQAHGRRLRFALPATVLTGLDPSSITPSGYSWRYVKPPEVTDIRDDVHSVTVELALVPLPPT